MFIANTEQEIGPRSAQNDGNWDHSDRQINRICYAIFSTIAQCEKREQILDKLKTYFDSIDVQEDRYKPVLKRTKPLIKRRVIAGADISDEGLEAQFEHAYELVELIAKLVYWDMNDPPKNRAKHQDPNIDDLIYSIYEKLEDEIELHHDDDLLSAMLNNLDAPPSQVALHEQIRKIIMFILQRRVINGYAVHTAAQHKETSNKNIDGYRMEFAADGGSLDYDKHFYKTLQEFVRLIEWDLK